MAGDDALGACSHYGDEGREWWARFGPWWSNDVIMGWMQEAQLKHIKEGDCVVSAYEYDGPESFLAMNIDPPKSSEDGKPISLENSKLEE